MVLSMPSSASYLLVILHTDMCMCTPCMPLCLCTSSSFPLECAFPQFHHTSLIILSKSPVKLS